MTDNSSDDVNTEIHNIEDQKSYHSITESESNNKINDDILTEALNKILDVDKENLKSLIYEQITPGVCRICLQPDTDELNKCVTPCFCRGTISKVHMICLELWLTHSETNKCEICKYEYKTELIVKYSILGSIKAWLCSTETREEVQYMLHDACVLITIIPIILLITYSGYHLINQIINQKHQGTTDDTIFRIVSFIIASSSIFCMNFCFTLWTSCRIQHHFSNWLHFYKNSQKIIVIFQK